MHSCSRQAHVRHPRRRGPAHACAALPAGACQPHAVPALAPAGGRLVAPNRCCFDKEMHACMNSSFITEKNILRSMLAGRQGPRGCRRGGKAIAGHAGRPAGCAAGQARRARRSARRTRRSWRPPWRARRRSRATTRPCRRRRWPLSATWSRWPVRAPDPQAAAGRGGARRRGRFTNVGGTRFGCRRLAAPCFSMRPGSSRETGWGAADAFPGREGAAPGAWSVRGAGCAAAAFHDFCL